MRIISGIRKGHVIHAPRNLPIRPTTDISKESLFNILVNRYDLEECSVLDLFSGSGSMSLEFASRGAKQILAIDKHHGCIKFLQSEAKKLGFEQIETGRTDVFYAIRNLYEKVDIIFADPPYAFTKYEEMITAIIDAEILNPGGILIVEHHSVNNFDHIKGFVEKRSHGQNVMSFYSPDQKE